MVQELAGKKVAILVADGFEQVELIEPMRALEQAGAEVCIVSPESDRVKGWDRSNWGVDLPVDVSLDDASPDDFDCLVLPGGVMSPDRLRSNETALRFVREIFDSGKPVAAICHGPWTLIDAGIAEGHTLTSYESIQADLKNAGAHWVDEPVVSTKGSYKP